VLFSVRCASAFDVAGDRITGIREAARERAGAVTG
jgi:hypothetical protein